MSLSFKVIYYGSLGSRSGKISQAFRRRQDEISLMSHVTQNRIQKLYRRAIMGRRIDLTGPPRLQPKDVRRAARSIGPSCTEIDLDDGFGPAAGSRRGEHDELDDVDESPFQVMCFLVEEDGGASVARINVYYQTGTVAICRVLLNGEIRQVFRRRCTLAGVERILRNPPQLTLVGLSASLVDESAYEVDGDSADSDQQGDVKELQRERKLHRDIEICDTGMAILQGELEWVRGQSAALEEAQLALAAETAEKAIKKASRAVGEYGGSDDDEDSEEEEDEDEGDDDNGSLSSRREFEFNLPQDTVADVETFLADSATDPVRCVAINGIGVVLIYQSGEWAYSSDGLPKKMRKALNAYGDQDDGGRHPPPRYAALGTDDRYFLSFGSGGRCGVWNGPSGLDEALTSGLHKDAKTRKKKNKHGPIEARRHRAVSSVAFGTKMDTWFVVFRDGSWEYRGKGIPEGLEALLLDRREQADLETVTLGPQG